MFGRGAGQRLFVCLFVCLSVDLEVHERTPLALLTWLPISRDSHRLESSVSVEGEPVLYVIRAQAKSKARETDSNGIELN